MELFGVDVCRLFDFRLEFSIPIVFYHASFEGLGVLPSLHTQKTFEAASPKTILPDLIKIVKKKYISIGAHPKHRKRCQMLKS